LNSFRQIWTVAAKDLAIEVRTKESINAAGAFSIAILLIFSFAFDPFSDSMHEFAGGLLWIAFGCAAVIAAERFEPGAGKSSGELRHADCGGADFAVRVWHFL
jgi:heme exporter protein B